MPCMNSTSACERGGSVAFVDGGSVLLGLPGAPGCTTTGLAESFCCAATAADKTPTKPRSATRRRNGAVTFTKGLQDRTRVATIAMFGADWELGTRMRFENAWNFRRDAAIFAKVMAYSVSRSEGVLSIIVPRRFNALLFAFFPLWTALWISFAVKDYGRGINESASSLLGMVLFGLVSMFFLIAWLWNLAGREELNFTIAGLQHRRVLFGIAGTRTFRMSQIAEPHFVGSVRRGRSRIPSGLGFRYRGQRVRIGDNLTQQEAREIVALVTHQFPEVASVWSQFAEGLPEPDEFLTLKLR